MNILGYDVCGPTCPVWYSAVHHFMHKYFRKKFHLKMSDEFMAFRKDMLAWQCLTATHVLCHLPAGFAPQGQ